MNLNKELINSKVCQLYIMKVFLNCHHKISASSAASIGSCPHLYITLPAVSSLTRTPALLVDWLLLFCLHFGVQLIGGSLIPFFWVHVEIEQILLLRHQFLLNHITFTNKLKSPLSIFLSERSMNSISLGSGQSREAIIDERIFSLLTFRW